MYESMRMVEGAPLCLRGGQTPAKLHVAVRVCCGNACTLGVCKEVSLLCDASHTEWIGSVHAVTPFTW